MSYLTPNETAVNLAVVFTRSGQSRARVSGATIKKASGGSRKVLKSGFIRPLRSSLEDLGWGLQELESGGYAAISLKSLEAAKPVTMKRYFTDLEKKSVRKGGSNIMAFLQEITPQEDGVDDDDF